MSLAKPTCLHDVVVDGIIEQAGVDAMFPLATRMEFSLPSSADPEMDANVEVRLHPQRQDVTGIRAAVIRDSSWMWTTIRGEELFISELSGTVDYDARLITAARTLFGHCPAVFAPHDDGSTSVVMLTDFTQRPPLKTALTAGLSRVRPADRQRALQATAAYRGLTFDGSRFSDGTTVDELNVGPSPVNYHQVLADGFYSAAEHTLLFDGRFPNAHVRLLDDQRADIISTHGSTTAHAIIVAELDNQRWRWNPRIPVRRFGLDHGIIPFAATALPLDLAAQLHMSRAICPVIGRGVVTKAQRGQERVIVALEAPELRLPAPTEAAIRATLYEPLPDGVDKHRALSAYARYRGVEMNHGCLVAPDTGALI